MQFISSLNKNSWFLTFNICIYSRLWLNSITAFSTSTCFGISTCYNSSECVELLQRLQLEINCLNSKKRKLIKPIWIGKVYFRVEMFFFCSLRLTFKCNGFFWLIGLYRKYNRLKACSVVLNSSNSHWLQIEIVASHTRKWNCSMQLPMNTAY